MRPPRRLICLVGSIVALAVLAWLVFPSHGPSYHGKSLSYWRMQLHTSWPGRNPQNPNGPDPRAPQLTEAVEAIRAIGTNALPQLLAELEIRDSAFKKRLVALAKRRSVLKTWALDEDERRQSVFEAFQILGTRASPAIPALVEILNRGDPDLTEPVAATFFYTGSNGIPPLIHALQHTNAEVRAAAVSGLARYAWIVKPSNGVGFDEERIDAFAVQIIPPLLPLAADTNSHVRERVPGALGRFHRQPDLVVPVLIKLLDDTNSTTRRYAVESLGAFGKDAQIAVPPLFRLLKDSSDPPLVGDVVRAVQRIDPPVVPMLIARLKDASPAARISAVLALQTLGRDASPAVPALVEALKDTAPDVRVAAAMSIRFFGPEANAAIPALIEALGDSEPKIRYAAALSLGHFRADAKSAVPALIETLKDPERAVRASATNALQSIEPSALPPRPQK